MKRFFVVIFLLLGLSFNSFGEVWNGPTEKKDTQMKYFMHTGFTFPVVLDTTIFSFNTITPVIVRTEFDITFLGKVMIPKNTKIIGTSLIEKTLDRVNVHFHTMVFPDGQEIKLNAIALHTDGSGGVPGKKKKCGKAMLPATILLSAAATGAETVSSSSVPAEMIRGISEETKKDLDQKIDYSITVERGIEILIYIVERLEY